MTTKTVTGPPDGEAPPALFDHCVKVYEAMLAQAQSPEDNENILVYEGYLTRLITSDLSFSVPYYTSIRKQLIRMGCIRQLKRGGGTAPSQYELVYEPTEEAFYKAREAPKRQGATKYDMLNDRITGLEQKVVDLEEQITAILEALQEKFGTEQVHE